MKLRDIGEIRLIEHYIYPYIQSEFRNEDAFFLEIIPNKFMIVNVDTFVRLTDAPRQMTYYHMGWKAVIMTISDIVAKGGKPRFFMLSVVAPANLDADFFAEAIRGVSEACNMHKCLYVGGDLNKGLDFELTGIAIGFSERIIRRNTIKVGDAVWITGEFGYTGVALHYLLKNGHKVSGIDHALEKFFKPKINLLLSEGLKKVASAAMDSSDGLIMSLYQLAYASGVKIILNDKIPIPPLVERYAKANNLDPMDLIFYGGEEFEVVFTSSLPDDQIINLFRQLGLPKPYRIGRAEKGLGVYYRGEKVDKRGWQHFE